MIEKNANSTNALESSPSASHRVGYTMVDALAKARRQIDISCFPRADVPQAKEIVMIIAEIYRLPPAWEVQIDGGKLPAGMVAEVYEELTEEHVQSVISEISKITHQIKFIKSYLRTALYNAVFTYTTRELNDAAVSIGDL